MLILFMMRLWAYTNNGTSFGVLLLWTWFTCIVGYNTFNWPAIEILLLYKVCKYGKYIINIDIISLKYVSVKIVSTTTFLFKFFVNNNLSNACVGWWKMLQNKLIVKFKLNALIEIKKMEKKWKKINHTKYKFTL